MADRDLPPAINGTELRIDALRASIDRLCDILAPAAKPEPADGETIELREPERPAAPTEPARAKRRR